MTGVPLVPLQADPTILGLMVGGMVGVFRAFGREMMATSRQRDPDDYGGDRPAPGGGEGGSAAAVAAGAARGLSDAAMGVDPEAG